MAKVTFQGEVRGYSVGDDGQIRLSVDESEPSPGAQMFVHDMVKSFNPGSGRAGFGSKDVPCPIKPGFSSYRVALSKEEAQGISHGSIVELTVDFFFVRRVVFVPGRNGKAGRWAGIPELFHEVLSVKPVTSLSSHRVDRAPESVGASSGGSSSGSGGGRNK